MTSIIKKIVLVFLGLIGLVLTACGGFVTVIFTGDKGGYSGLGMLGLGSLVAGVIVLLIAVKWFKKINTSPQQP